MDTVPYLLSCELVNVSGTGVQLLPPEHDEAQHGAGGHFYRKGQNAQASSQGRLGDIEEHEGKSRQERGHKDWEIERVEPDHEPGVFLVLVHMDHRVVSGCRQAVRQSVSQTVSQSVMQEASSTTKQEENKDVTGS